MSVSTLTIPTPESCKACKLAAVDVGVLVCAITGNVIRNHNYRRHPDCPLIIKYTLADMTGEKGEPK